VESAVQPGYLVVENVPHKILQVEQEQAGQHSPDEAGDAGGFPGHLHVSPVPVEDRGGQDVDQVVVQGEGQAAAHLVPRDGAAGLELVAADERRRPQGEAVQQHEGQAEEEVDADGEQHGEEGGAQEAFVAQQQVPRSLEE